MWPKVYTTANSIFLWGALLLAPIRSSLLAVLALVACDLVVGIIAARKRGEKITSWGLRKTVSKTLAYQLAVVLSYVMEKNFLDFLPVVKAVAGFIAITEFKSVMEGLSTISGLDMWTSIRSLIQGTKVNEEKKNDTNVDGKGP